MPSSVTDRPNPVVAEILSSEKIPSIALSDDASNDQQLRETTPPQTSCPTNDAIITPDRNSPSLLSEEHASYLSMTPPKKPDKCDDKNLQPKSNNIITPVMFRPPLKAGPRSDKRKGRKLGKSMIATDTPEKERIAEERSAALNRKSLHKRKVLQECENQLLSTIKKIRKTPKQRRTKRVVPDEDSDSSEVEEIILDSETELDSDNEDNEMVVIDENFPDLQRKPKINEYVLVLLRSKKQVVYYIAKILETENDDEYCISFLKLKDRFRKTFMFPLEPDMANVKINDIKLILPPPCVTGTKRLIKYSFDVNFSFLNIG